MKELWMTLLNKILVMPGAKINRINFLSETFDGVSSETLKKIIEGPITSVVSVETLDKVVKHVINNQILKVTTLSAIAGIPGGPAMLATIPADIVNFYYHTVIIGQKLGYLWGFPEMLDDNGNMTDDGKIMLTGFIGVMNKVACAEKLIKEVAKELVKRAAGEATGQMATKLLIKPFIAQSVEQVVKKLSLQIATKGGSRGITKAIPLISGVICGVMTYSSFKKQTKKLNLELKSIVIKEDTL